MNPPETFTLNKDAIKQDEHGIVDRWPEDMIDLTFF
jgi:hypothetical protein